MCRFLCPGLGVRWAGKLGERRSEVEAVVAGLLGHLRLKALPLKTAATKMAMLFTSQR